MKAILTIKFNKVGAFNPEIVREINKDVYRRLIQSTEKLCEKIAKGLEKDYFKKAKLDTTISYEIISEKV